MKHKCSDIQTINRTLFIIDTGRSTKCTRYRLLAVRVWLAANTYVSWVSGNARNRKSVVEKHVTIRNNVSYQRIQSCVLRPHLYKTHCVVVPQSSSDPMLQNSTDSDNHKPVLSAPAYHGWPRELQFELAVVLVSLGIPNALSIAARTSPPLIIIDKLDGWAALDDESSPLKADGTASVTGCQT